MTNAEFTRALGRLNRDIANALVSLTEGMSNPNFCSASADEYAASFLPDMRSRLQWMENRTRAPLSAWENYRPDDLTDDDTR